jgi:UPF0042 nucleotide-binding protein
VSRLRNIRVVIITGLSGSGKSTALRALEDAGFICVDNLPVALLPSFLTLRESESQETLKVALVMDLREPDFLSHHEKVFEDLTKSGFRLQIIFLETNDSTLFRRFSQTRRTHPGAESSTLAEAIVMERKALYGLRNRADSVIDTSELSVHDLKKLIIDKISGPLKEKRLQVTIISFGFKFGLPHEADIVMDVRYLPNPFFVPELREKNGLDREVAEYVFSNGQAEKFLNQFSSMLIDLLPLYEAEGKAYLTIGIGCTGGHHRSVTIIEKLADLIEPRGYDITIRHRDIDL